MFGIFPKDDHNQTLRIKRFLMAFGSYVMWSMLAVFLHYQATTRVTFNILVISLSGILAINVLIYAVIRTGFNKRFKDPSLTLFQMTIATFWIMVIVYYADSIRNVALLVYLIVFVFGLFRLNVRQFIFLSAFAIVNYSLVILLLYKTHPESINLRIDVLNIVILAMVLPWFSLIGGYITKLRDKISDTLSSIKRLTDNVEDVIFYSDMNLNYTYVSPSVKILRGYEPEEVLQQTIADTFTPSSLDLPMNTFFKAMELEKSGRRVLKSRTLDLEVKRKDGTTVWTETKFSFIRDKNQQLAGILGVIRDITERKLMEEKLHLTLEGLRKAVGTTIQVLVSAIEARDPYTAGHQSRVADLARAIATEMGLDQDKIEGIRMAGSIHDIGKLSVPSEILIKPTKLTDLEFTLIKEHSSGGYEILKNVESPWPLAQIVYQHHERMNGTGYPRKLKGDEILLEARIMAVADVVEAMATHRPYRPALGIDAALDEIEKNKGILYDVAVVDACLKLFREKSYQFPVTH